MGIFGSDNSIVVCLDRSHYNQGEELTGSVLLQITGSYGQKVDGIFLKIQGLEECEFTVTRTRTVYVNGKSQTETYTKTVYGSRYVMKHSFMLHAGTSLFLPGQYAFPFSFRLDDHLPTSFDLRSGLKCSAKGSLSYRVAAVGKVPGMLKMNLRGEIPFHVLGSVQSSRGPQEIISSSSITFLCCIPRGEVRLLGMIDQSAYSAGSEARLRVFVDNGGTEIRIPKIKVKLRCSYTLTASGSDTDYGTVDVVSMSLPGIEKKGTFDTVMPVNIPQNIPPTYSGCHVSVSYQVLVIMEVPWSVNATVKIPVHINPHTVGGTPSPLPSAAPSYMSGIRNVNPVVELSKMDECPPYSPFPEDDIPSTASSGKSSGLDSKK